jgi:hypothetical protein
VPGGFSGSLVCSRGLRTRLGKGLGRADASWHRSSGCREPPVGELLPGYRHRHQRRCRWRDVTADPRRRPSPRRHRGCSRRSPHLGRSATQVTAPAADVADTRGDPPAVRLGLPAAAEYQRRDCQAAIPVVDLSVKLEALTEGFSGGPFRRADLMRSRLGRYVRLPSRSC